MLEHEGFFWKKRVVRALSEASPWQGEALFTAENPRRWLGTGIQKSLEKYADDPDVGNSALIQLGLLSSAGADSDVLLRMIAVGLRSTDSLRRQSVHTVVNYGRFEPLRPILESALEDRDADVRMTASAKLCKHPESRLLLAHADDPEPGVRANVVTLLNSIDQTAWQEEEQAALARFLVDDDAKVRKQAWDLLVGLPTVVRNSKPPAEQLFEGNWIDRPRSVYIHPLPDGVYRSLIERPASERVRLASMVANLPSPLCFELALALSHDSDEKVLSAVYGVRGDLPFWENPDATLQIVSNLLDNPAVPAASIPWEQFYASLRPLNRTRSGLVALARWTMARNAVSLLGSISDTALAECDPKLWADSFTWRFEHDLLAWQHVRGLWTAGTRPLVEDRSRPLVLRMLQLDALCNGRAWDEGLVRQIFADPAWGGFEQEEWIGLEEELHELLDHMPRDARNRAITVMLDNAAMPEWLSARAISTFDPRSPGAAAIGKRVLERWFGEEGQNAAVFDAIQAMAELPELRDDRVLAEATHRKEYATPAWNTIAALKDPVFLPLIRSALEQSGEPMAAQALFGYLSDDAAEILLLAAAKVQGDLRDQCLAHLEKIREYQDSRERWATRKVKTATREQVLAQLLEQLGAKSDDVKVQAIRALATWEAVEAMPRLIELTTSGSKPVAAAAREALDRLNAPKKD